MLEIPKQKTDETDNEYIKKTFGWIINVCRESMIFNWKATYKGGYFEKKVKYDYIWLEEIVLWGQKYYQFDKIIKKDEELLNLRLLLQELKFLVMIHDRNYSTIQKDLAEFRFKYINKQSIPEPKLQILAIENNKEALALKIENTQLKNKIKELKVNENRNS